MTWTTLDYGSVWEENVGVNVRARKVDKNSMVPPEEQIRSYIVENFLLGDEGELTASDSLLESGVLDSTGVLELVGFIEETFGVEVSNEDLVPENLDSINNVASFVEWKLKGRAEGVTKTA